MWSVHSGEGIAQSLKDRRSLQAGILEGILENLEREAVPENPEPFGSLRTQGPATHDTPGS